MRKPELWPKDCLIITGPRKCGLSTLANAWAKDFQSSLVQAEEVKSLPLGFDSNAYLHIDDVDKLPLDGVFLAMIAALGRKGQRLLLTSHKSPADWSLQSPDLGSRLKSMPIMTLGPPDEEMMRARIKRGCQRYYLIMPQAVEDYLVLRLGLNYEAIENALDKLNSAVSEKPLTIPFVSEVLLSDDG